MTACGDCGLERMPCMRPACKCGPRWIREAFDVGGSEVGSLIKALVERLPLQRMQDEVVAVLAGKSGTCEDEDPLLELADLVVDAIVVVLTDDDEVVTLTELYQGASRALDKAGAPYAEQDGAQLDLPERIRWLADQRPTRIGMEREVNTVKAELGRLLKDIETARGELRVNLDDMPPGSKIRQVVIANSLLRQERDRLAKSLSAVDHVSIELNKAVKGCGLWKQLSNKQHDDLVSMKQENDALTERVSKMEDAVKAREDRIAALVQENEDLMAERSDMETEIEHLEDEMHADDAEGDL